MTRSLVSIVVALALSAGLTAQGQVYKPGNGVTLPAVAQKVNPQYTTEAKNAGLQGTVTLNIVVRADGSVGDVQVTQSLDTKYGLDDQAVKAAQQWQFKPGTKDGKAVDVQISLEMTFTLK